MTIKNDVVEAIGNTPLIKLKRASELTGCTILGKAEFMNPGQSVKDRAGKWMILEAEKRGELKPGGLVVEATAGNTGIGLAVVASARGYRTLIVIPETQSQEKKDFLKLCGAELIEVPALPYSNPNNYQHVGRRLADELRKTEPNGVLFADQWNNLDNAQGALRLDRPRDLGADRRQGRRLRLLGRQRRHARRRQPLSEREEQGHPDRLRRSAWRRHVRIFQDRRRQGDARRLDHGRHRARSRTAIVESAKVDDAYLIPDAEAVTVIYELLQHEGLCLGGSTGINIVGAMRLAKQLGPGKTIVTILCDSGSRYQSKLFNADFMRAKNLPVPEWLEKRSNIKLPFV